MTSTPADETNDIPDPMEVARTLGRLLRIHMPQGTTSSHERMALIAALLDGCDALPEMEFPSIPIPIASWNEGVIDPRNPTPPGSGKQPRTASRKTRSAA